MKGIFIIGMLLVYLVALPTSVNSNIKICNTCEQPVERCVCEGVLSENTMDGVLAVPDMNSLYFGSIAVSAGITLGAGFLYRREKAKLIDSNSGRLIRKVNIRKRREGYLVRLPSVIADKEMILRFKDEFAIRNEGCSLYIVHENKEYETLISSEIYISEEEKR